MKVKTSELTGKALDCAVALALGGTDLLFDTVSTWWITLDGKDRALSSAWSATQCFAPSSDDRYGGPIIDQKKIGTWFNSQRDCWVAASREWIDAVADSDVILTMPDPFYGPTRLTAAMRCLVVTTLGDEVDIPSTLLK